jgi:hypothetical protein
VFFDALNIPWQYEPQGFMVGGGYLDQDPPRPYLPDFYLPDRDIWVEVKPSIKAADWFLMADVVIPHWGIESAGLLMLFDVPRPTPGRAINDEWPVLLTFHKGDIYVSPYDFRKSFDWSTRCLNVPAGNDCGREVDPRAIQHASDDNGRLVGPSVHAALRSARSARFEHRHAA